MVARQHTPQGTTRSVDRPQVRNLRDSLVLLGGQLLEGRERSDHRIIDPDVDGPELSLDALCGAFHLARMRDVGGNSERPAATLHNLDGRGLQAARFTCKQSNRAAFARESNRSGPANAGGSAGDHDDRHGGAPATTPAIWHNAPSVAP